MDELIANVLHMPVQTIVFNHRNVVGETFRHHVAEIGFLLVGEDVLAGCNWLDRGRQRAILLTAQLWSEAKE